MLASRAFRTYATARAQLLGRRIRGTSRSNLQRLAEARVESVKHTILGERAACESLEREIARKDFLNMRAARESMNAKIAKQDLDIFISKLFAVSTGTSAEENEESRIGAPLPTTKPLGEVLVGIPLMADDSVTAAWAAFEIAQQRSWPLFRQAMLPGQGHVVEEKDVHARIAPLIKALVPESLRIWYEANTDNATARGKVSFIIASARDAGPSFLGALVVVEVAKPGDLNNALYQTRAYLRHRVRKLFMERLQRGESLHDICVFGIATDGEKVAFVRMHSGAPPPGESFENCEPCPVDQTEHIELLPCCWNSNSPPPLGGQPTTGFKALAQLCSAPQAALGLGGPIASLRAQMRWSWDKSAWMVPGSCREDAGSGGEVSVLGDETREAEQLDFGLRLGCGGTSDVYELESVPAGAAPPATAARRDLVVKVSRFAAKHVTYDFVSEYNALQALRPAARTGLVPELVGWGHRVRAATDDTRAMPLLALRPRGEPLQGFIGARAAGAAAAHVGRPADAAAASFAARLAAAREVSLRVLAALEMAHAARIVHCDVRPANIVVVPTQGAMLIDWGCASKVGEMIKRCGVCAYADLHIFAREYLGANPARDAMGLLFSFLAMVYDDTCTAPWLAGGGGLEEEQVLQARDDWICTRSRDDPVVESVAVALDALGALREVDGAEACAAIVRAAVSQLPGGVYTIQTQFKV